MNYDVSIFKQKYANGIIKLMYCETVFLLIGIIFRILPIQELFFLSAVLIGLIGFVALPMTYCFYLRMKRQAERQRQWVKEGTLYVQRCKDNGLRAGGFVVDKDIIVFEQIYSIALNRKFITITGKIHILNQFNGVEREKNVNTYSIPRVFTNEEIMLNLGGKDNG